MMRPKKLPLQAFDVDVQQILQAPTDAKTILIRVVVVLAAVVVALLLFDYYWTENSPTAQFLERRWGRGAPPPPDPDAVETVLDGAGHVQRRVVFQAPRRFHQQNVDWNKKRWQEAIGAKLALNPDQP